MTERPKSTNKVIMRGIMTRSAAALVADVVHARPEQRVAACNAIANQHIEANSNIDLRKFGITLDLRSPPSPPK
jgi:Ni,Fe-hydrogenase III small subunit